MCNIDEFIQERLWEKDEFVFRPQSNIKLQRSNQPVTGVASSDKHSNKHISVNQSPHFQYAQAALLGKHVNSVINYITLSMMPLWWEMPPQ